MENQSPSDTSLGTKRRNYYQLNDGEKVVGGTGNFSVVLDVGGFVVTSQRVIKVDRTGFGQRSHVHSINLENLDSIQTSAKKHYVFIFLAIILFLLFASNNKPEIGFIPLLLFILIFYATRKKIIRLASGNSEMILNVISLAHERIQEVVFCIEQAKQRRLEGMQNTRISSHSNEKTGMVDSESRLMELKKLFDKGLLDEQEYMNQRSRVISSL